MGSVGPSQGGLSTSRGLGKKPTAFVLPCSAALGVTSRTPHSPDTYPHPPVTALQVGSSLRPPRIPSTEEDIIDVSRSSGRWQGLQTQPSHRIASRLHGCMLTHFLPLELLFCFGFLPMSISCNHYLTIIEQILWSVLNLKELFPRGPAQLPKMPATSNPSPPARFQPNSILS